MARLQGADFGGNRFKGSARSIDVTPVKAASSDKAIKGYREQVTRNQKTQNREQERQFKLENLEQSSTDAVDRAAQKIKFQAEANDLKAQQLKEKGDLRLEQQNELDDLQLETSWIRAKDQLNAATVAAQGQFESAKISFIGNTVNSLLSFAGSAVKYGEFKFSEEQKEEQRQATLKWIGGKDLGLDFNYDSVVQADETQDAIDVTAETAIQRTTNDPILQERLRGPSSDAHAERKFNQTSTRDFGTSVLGTSLDILESDEEIAHPSGQGTFRINNPPDFDAATHAARYAIAKSFHQANVQGLDAAEAVRTLKGQVENAYSQLVQKLYTKVHQTKLENRLFKIKTNFFSQVASKQFTPDEMFQQLSRSLQTTGGYSQGEANKMAFETMRDHFKGKNDTGSLSRLYSVQQVPGQAGSELGFMYGEDIETAINDSYSDLDTIKARDEKQIKTEMFEAISGLNPQERIPIIAQYIDRLEQGGHHEAATRLAGDLENLQFPHNASIGDATIEQKIAIGEVRTKAQADEMLATGGLTEEGHKKAVALLEQDSLLDMPEDKGAERKLKAAHTDIETTLTQALGFKKNDQTGDYIIDKTILGEAPFVSKGEAKRIVQQAKDDLTILTNELIRQNPELVNNPQRLSSELNSLVNSFMKENFKTEGGKYFVGDYLKGTEGRADTNIVGVKVWSEEQKQRFPNLLSDSEKFSRIQSEVIARTTSPRGGPPVMSPINWSGFFDKETNKLTSYAIERYRPLRGDTLMTAEQFDKAYTAWTKGEVDPVLQSIATQVGRSPLAVLNEHTSSPLTPNLKLFNPTTVSTPLQQSTAPASAVEGAAMLMQRGFPTRGAAFLAGNIQQESTWYGQRPSWNDVGAPAGGLVSWRAGRLDAIEKYFDKPIEQITNAQQLDYLEYELKTFYPEADALFRNPYATERQLIRASKMYWGYGEEGKRYRFARDILRQQNY